VTGEQPFTVTVVLPAHNEEGNISTVVHQSLEVLPTVAETFEIIVVNDGSRDGTGDVADKLAADDQRVRVIHHARNLGYGCAWRSGIDASTNDWIFFMDSDRQFDIAEIAKLVAQIPGNEIVAGYRIRRNDPFYRFVVGSWFNILVTLLFDVHLVDIDCGFKMFRSNVLKSMVLNSPGALINTEIHAKANRAGARLAQVGINHYPRPAGRQSGTRLKVMFSAVVEIFKLRWNLRSYDPAPVIAAIARDRG
jgi:glycosyltransferase involved in cell wall biosynthesis